MQRTFWVHLVEALRCREPRCECQRNRGDNHTLHCPAHRDEHPSLAVTVQGDKVLLHCFAGCSQKAVIDVLRERGLWGEEKKHPPSFRYRPKQRNRFRADAGCVG